MQALKIKINVEIVASTFLEALVLVLLTGEMGSSDMIYLPSFMKIILCIQVILRLLPQRFKDVLVLLVAGNHEVRS
jgi:hypothetical protein